MVDITIILLLVVSLVVIDYHQCDHGARCVMHTPNAGPHSCICIVLTAQIRLMTCPSKYQKSCGIFKENDTWYPPAQCGHAHADCKPCDAALQFSALQQALALHHVDKLVGTRHNARSAAGRSPCRAKCAGTMLKYWSQVCPVMKL